MGSKNFRVQLKDSAYMSVQFITCSGVVMSFVVRLMVDSGLGHRCAIRYDTAHGKPHKDVVDYKGRLLEKYWLPELTFGKALCFAIADIKENHEVYIENYRKTQSGGNS